MKFDYSSYSQRAAINLRMSIYDFNFLRPFMAFDFIKKCTKEVNEIVKIISEKKIKVNMIEIKHYSYETGRIDFDKMYDWHKETFNHAFLFHCVDPRQGRFAIEYSNNYGSPNGFSLFKFVKKYKNYFRIHFIKTYNNPNRVTELSTDVDFFLKNGAKIP